MGRQAAAEPARDAPDDDDRRRGREGRQQTNAPERIAQERDRDLGHDRDQRRLVDVAPGQVPRAGHEVEFVPLIPVAPGREKMKDKRRNPRHGR